MRAFPACRWFVWGVAAASIASAAPSTQAAFASPKDAASALFAAIESGDYPVFLSIAGDRMAAFWNAGDGSRGALQRMRFADAARDHGFTTRPVSAVKVTLYVPGMPDGFPAPLIKTGSGWQFDAEAGATIFKAQRIGSNEAAVVELGRRLREAEATWSARAQGGAGYTQKIRSTDGQHDGLYWAGGEGEDQEESPLGPVFAAAAYSEREPTAEPTAEPRPLFGYYIRILAPTRAAFAFIAWPAEYGATGARSFLITQEGDVYRRDLGRDSARFASKLTGIPSLKGWTRVPTSKDSE
ncbi:MAG: DUF2950 family protein [Candidatus Solibacter sp.]